MGGVNVSGASFESVMALMLVGTASVLVLSSFGSRAAPLVAVMVTLVAISLYEPAIREGGELISYLGELSGAKEYTRAALKVIGVSFLSGISKDVLTELGEVGIARSISLVTRLELFLISLPFVKEMLTALLSLLES
jgi:hypothetical protein